MIIINNLATKGDVGDIVFALYADIPMVNLPFNRLQIRVLFIAYTQDSLNQLIRLSWRLLGKIHATVSWETNNGTLEPEFH